ncbi:MAG TPA: glutamate racemase [Thermoanaerobaculia bacterium]|nr:glutamate racemase [Thermoanaerobaculia bacterium]
MDAIGVFDSGVGGLTVVAALRRRLPRESILYLGDTARLPYGSKSPATVTRYTRRNVDFLAQHGVKAVVVACNTASALALPELALPMPVWGVIEPGAERAAAASSGRVGVIATEATVRSDAYPRALRRLRPELQISSRACPLFVPLVEEGWHDDPITEQVARRYLAPLLAGGIDTLVLGCTHYPLLAPVLAKVAGPAVGLVDSAEAVAEAVAAALEAPGALTAPMAHGPLAAEALGGPGTTGSGGDSAPGSLRVCVTDAGQGFQTLARRILGAPDLCLEWVEVV